MSGSLFIVIIALLAPLAVIITYYDVRYRRIPNAFVLATLVCGLLINGILNGLGGLGSSVGGCLVAFGMMFALHLFGAMGAGDVKLFAAIGSLTGANLVLPTFLVVILTGGARDDAPRAANPGGLAARLGAAALQRADGPQTHDPLRGCHHVRQPHLAGNLPRLNGRGPVLFRNGEF